MIFLPTPPVRGQPIRADLLAELIAALRRCRPIPGSGILIQETLQGAVISLASRPQALSSPFDHPFRVAHGRAASSSGGAAITITQGCAWRISPEGRAQRLQIAPGEGVTETAAGWQCSPTASGLLALRYQTGLPAGQAGGEALTLDLISTDAEDQTFALPIATLTNEGEGSSSSGSADAANITIQQHLVGDAFLPAAGLALGPLEHLDTGDYAGKLIQHLGTWVWDTAAQAWSFSAAKDAQGEALAPAVVYPTLAAELLHRAVDAEDNAPAIATLSAPILFPGKSSVWLRKQDASALASGLAYTPPETETDQGILGFTPLSFSFWAESAPAAAPAETLLSTVTEDANATTTYEAASGAGEA